MPHHVVLGNFTDEGIRNIWDLPKHRDEANRRIAEAGIKVQCFFTLGQYDEVVLLEAPSDEAVATTAMTIGGQGHVRTTTRKAFTEDEFFQLVGRPPSS